MNADEAETRFLGWLGDLGDRHYLLLDPKLPDKDNNLISLRSSLPPVEPKLPYKSNNLILSVKLHTGVSHICKNTSSDSFLLSPNSNF
jgi:hypothetical protein